MVEVEEILKGRDEDEFMLDCCMNFGTFFSDMLGLEWTIHQRRIYENMNKYRKVVVEAPRQHGKTTLILAFVLHKIFFNRNLDILIVCNAFRQSLDRMRDLRNMIIQNPLLSTLISTDREKGWSKTEFTTATNCHVIAKPYTENIRGGTYDFVLCDEVSQYKDKSIFWGVIQPTVETKNGSVFAIGTPISKVDLLADLFQPNSPYVGIKLKAIMNGKPLWPGKYPMEKLMEIKNSMPSLEWEREYMCNPVSSEVSLYPYELLMSCFNYEMTLLQTAEKNTSYYGGFDSAMSVEKKGSFAAWCVVDKNGRVVWIERAKEPFREQFDRTIRLQRVFNCVKWIVDRGYTGDALIADLVAVGLPVEGFNFQGDGKKDLHNKLRVEFQNKRIIIPRNIKSPDTIKQTDNLIAELNSFIPTISKNQRVIYESVAPYDDSATSLALAIWGKSGIGNFSWQVI